MAQEPLPMTLEKGRRKMVLHGMLISSAWAMGNTAWSIFSLTQDPSFESKSFHEMNLAWAGINTVVFGLGAVRNLSKKNYPLNLADAYKIHSRDKKIFKVNFFLDIAYLVAGGSMVAVAGSNDNKNTEQRLRGFGTSLLVQGSYLLVFDGVMCTLLKKRDPLYKDL